MNVRHYFAGAIIAACIVAVPTSAQTASDGSAAAPAQLPQGEPPAKIVVDPPIAESLKLGRVVIRYRTENLDIVPVFGEAALAISPRIGHVHVIVDDLSWHYQDASGEAVTIVGLRPGPHKVLVQLESAAHHLLDQHSVSFVVPRVTGGHRADAQPPSAEPPAKIIIDPPSVEPLARGVIIINYRVGNIQIAPVFGDAALDVVPRVGHIKVTVDDYPWSWEDASGEPVSMVGLAPGPHKILIQLVDPNDQPIDQGTVVFTVPNV
jgi:hypothetical protein